MPKTDHERTELGEALKENSALAKMGSGEA